MNIDELAAGLEAALEAIRADRRRELDEIADMDADTILLLLDGLHQRQQEDARVAAEKKRAAGQKQSETRIRKAKEFWDAELADFQDVLAAHNGKKEAAIAHILERLVGKRKSESQVWEHLKRRGL